jgi:hypothetical protein
MDLVLLKNANDCGLTSKDRVQTQEDGTLRKHFSSGFPFPLLGNA